MSSGAEGRLAAAATLSRTVLRPEVRRVIEDYERLDSEEARARYADHFLGRTAGVMDEIWPTFYELLKRVEDEHLYEKPGYLSGDKVFGSFKDYFEYRVGHPYETFLELEGTYHYAVDYKRDLLKKAFNVARSVAEKAGALVKAQEGGLEINKGAGPIPRANRDVITVRAATQGGTDPDYLTRRIARERPDILGRMAAGEYRSVHAAAVEAGIAPRVQTVRMDDPESAARTLRKHMPGEALLRLAKLLTEEER